MANPDVTDSMRLFISGNDDQPIRNSRFEHNARGELVLEECEGFKGRYVKTSATGNWRDLFVPFDGGAA